MSSLMRTKDLLAISDLATLRKLKIGDYFPGDVIPEVVTHFLKLCQCFWMHGGDMSKSHAELTSGKCSDGFVNTLEALTYPNLCDIFADEICTLVNRKFNGPVGWTVGSDHAGAALAQSVARLRGDRFDFCEKGKVDVYDVQLWKRFQIREDEPVLRIEELVTTAKTIGLVTNGIRQSHDHPIWFAPVIGTLVHRSDVYEFGDAKIIYLVHYDIHTWDPKDCPLCKAGSKAIKPRKNWKELTGQ